MAGRTDRVNARDVMDRADGILFEGEAIRTWVSQLKKRAKGKDGQAAGAQAPNAAKGPRIRGARRKES